MSHMVTHLSICSSTLWLIGGLVSMIAGFTVTKWRMRQRWPIPQKRPDEWNQYNRAHK